MSKGYLYKKDKNLFRGDSYIPHGKEGVGDYFDYTEKEGSEELSLRFDVSEKAVVSRLKWLLDHHYFSFDDLISVSKFLFLKHYEAFRDDKTETEFNQLATKWRKETGGYSTMIHIAGNNNYLDIIGMGEKVVPFILRDLEKEVDFWFIALKHITKANPVPREHLGDIEKMREDWLQWGRENNLI